MNHAQKIVYLGNLLRTNLDAKGVTVNQNATMKEMIDSILDIPPVTVGISLSSSLNLSVPSNIKYYDTVVLTATLTVFYDDTSQTNVDMHGTLQGATVIFKDGQNNTIGSAITDINGVATYNITANSSSMEYYAVFSGTDDYSSSTSNHVTINPQHDYNLEFSQDIYLASSGSATVSCTLTDNGVPVPNATVSLSGSDGSLYTGITNSSGIAQVTVSVSADTTFTASYSNVSDTCVVTVSRVIYQPALDGTESITTIRTYTPKISNNELVRGCGYLTNGWDNTIDWVLTFEYYVTGDNNGYLVLPKGTTQRDKNGIQQWYSNQLNFRVNGSSPSGNITSATSTNQWINVKVTKVGYVWKVYYNDILKTTWNASSYASTLDTWTEMCIGLDRDSNRNSAKIRNIKVEIL